MQEVEGLVRSPPQIGQMQHADEKKRIGGKHAGGQNQRKHSMLAEVCGGLTSRLLGG